LIVTGNPFAVAGEHKGLEMEVYARTGNFLLLFNTVFEITKN
jgi:hypothetical protein